MRLALLLPEVNGHFQISVAHFWLMHVSQIFYNYTVE